MSVKNITLLQKLKLAARERHLKSKMNILQDFELSSLGEKIIEHGIMKEDSNWYLSFSGYKSIRSSIGNVGEKILPLTLFAKLYTGQKDGLISVEFFRAYCEANLFFQNTYFRLCIYDENGSGVLSVNQLKLFYVQFEEISAIIEKFQAKNLGYFYLHHICSYTLYILDPFKTRFIKISDFMKSSIIGKLMEIKDVDLNKEGDPIAEVNWFHPDYFIQNYHQYKIITNGTFRLDEKALKNFISLNSNRAFLNRFLEKSSNVGNFYDYENFVNMTLSFNCLTSIQSMKFFFDIIDTNEDGFLCDWDLKYFFKEQVAAYNLSQNKLNPGKRFISQNFESFTSEIYDIVLGSKAHERKFSLLNLVKCNQGDFIISLLVDSNVFRKSQNIDLR